LKLVLGDQTGLNPRSFVFLSLKPLFCQLSLTKRLEVAEQVFLGILQHPTKFQAKTFTGKYFS